MSATLAALMPVFGLIAIGCALKQLVFKSPAFWDPIEKLTYYVLFPALLVASIAQARVAGPTIIPAVAVLAAVTVVLLAVLAGLRPLLRIDGPAYSALVQGTIRFNTYVGLAAAAALYGRPGTALLAILLALMVPLSNVVSVVALTRHAGGDSSWRGLLVELASNPLILASIVGLSLSMTHTALPALVSTMLDALGRAALSLGLLAVGAGLSLGALTANSIAVGTSVLLKLIVYPLLAALGCELLELEPLARAVVILFAALPPAPSAFVLTRRLGGDHALMAGIITIHTILAAFSVPLALALLS